MDLNYNLPALSSNTTNQSIICYVQRTNVTIIKEAISITSNGIYAGTPFYQPYEFTILQDAYAIKPKYKEINVNHFLYFLSSIKKSIKPKYNYNNKAGWGKVSKDFITLPIDENDEIDYEYMKTFIKAIQKLVIKNVVDYAQRQIDLTKQIVNK